MAKIDKTELTKIIKNMGKSNKIFENEREFQIALAKEIQNQASNYIVMLECLTLNIGRDCRTDIVLIDKQTNEFISIELKYKKREANIGNVSLTQQSAQSFGRYDYLYDVYRNENLVDKKGIFDYNYTAGYSILLTNDYLYWKEPKKNTYMYEEFRLDNRGQANVDIKKGTKNWTLINNKMPKNIVDAKRDKGITLTRDYQGRWEQYYKDVNTEFKFLILETI